MENFNLHNEDKNFINTLLKNNKSFNNTNDYNIVNSVLTLFKLKKNNNLDCNNTLLNIFNTLNNDVLIHTNLKKIIAEKILTKMILATNSGLNKIPKDLFKNENFFNYILNTNLFTKKMNGKTPFEAILSSQKNMNHFNLNESITNTPNLEKFLLSESKYFYDKLVNLSRTVIYSKLMLRDIKKFIFFIKIVNNYVSKYENTESNKLIDANVKTYFMLLENINNVYLSSKESIELFELFSAKNLQDHNLLISRCTNDMNQCLIFLNDFFLDSKFNNYMLSLVNSVNLNKQSDKENRYESLILSILSIFSFKNIKYSTKTIYNINKIRNNIINHFEDFLKNNHFNIHQKVKFLLDISIPEFVKYFITEDNKFTLENEFVNLYIDIEKYNESNGFYDKLRLRSIIINILNESFLTTKKFNFLNKNNKTFKTFFTLLLSEYNSYSSKIEKFKSKIIELLKNDKYSLGLYPNMCSFIINLKKMISSYKIIHKIIHIDFVLADDFYISKLVQLNHSILHSHYYTRLYTELPLYNLSNLSLNLVSSIFSEKIHTYINTVYSDFLCLFSNDLFVKYIINNEEIYPMEILDKTKKIFGEYFIEVSSQKKIKVDKIIDDFKDKINNDKKIYKNDVYKTEIPENYLDPILLIPIKDPLELPNTKNIIDRETIINHLVFNKTNPFNGLPLCEEELLEYNKKTDVIERVNNFKYDFNNWKLDNKI